MNPAAATYTPLECFLLFQSLVTYGTDDESFVQISDLLTNNIFVKDGGTYDAGRLRSDALRDLYLNLLRDELKAEEDGQADGSQSGSRKRKVPSPALPIIKDAEEHRDKLPVLVDRLYARYRKSMVEAIQEDERRYAILRQEVEEIERGEWDERILKENAAITNKNGSVTPRETRAKVNGTSTAPQEKAAEVSVPSKEQPTKLQTSIQSPQAEIEPDELAVNDAPNSQESTKPPSPRIPESKAQPSLQNVPPLQRRSSSNGPHGPSPLQPNLQPPHTLQPGQATLQQQQQSGMAYKWETPMYGPPHQHPQPYQQAGPYPPQYNPQQYPPQPYPPPHRGSFPGHGLQHPHVPSSPINTHHPHQMALSPSGGGHRSPASPHGMPLDALADAAGQQYRATSGSPMLQPPQMQAGPMQPPPSGGYPPPYPQQRPQSRNGPPQWNNPSYIPPYQGSPGPPHQGPPSFPFQQQPQNQRPFASRPDLVPPENRQYTSPYNESQGARPPILQSMRQSLPSTPISQGRNRFSTGSGTQWTPNPTGSTPKAVVAVESPAWQPISPILRPTKSTPQKSSKKQTSKSEPKLKKQPQKRGSQRTRAGSNTSSVLAGSYRSQSVTSHGDELSLDNTVKEEVATPLPLPPGLEDETGDTTADESLPNTRNRPSNILTSPNRQKRKRHESIAETPREPSGPTTHVLWTRAFPKISASALEAITGHKSASMFAVPVKERDAHGYSSLILRPQDLKSIKSTINAGHRAATAAVPEDTPAGQSRVWLPKSEDLVPPKGIINYAQMEKELMRMFANAIMFNADPDRGLGASWDEIRGHGKKGGEGYEIDEDGVVKDTRAMYGDVEKIVESLRRAERKSEEMMGAGGTRVGSVVRGSSVLEVEDDVDELAAEAEADTGTLSKRRRRA